MVINGKDNARYTLSLPPGPTTSSKWQYYIAGGAVSSHTSERHIQLVNADTSNIAWRLGSLQVLKGNLRNMQIHNPLYMYLIHVHMQQDGGRGQYICSKTGDEGMQ